ncbi:hypothetical protein XENOCAPTIV_002316 [Xenoophorus captivus]|uniref:Uncharacterized protein n=1 Tax=Xenoophorus captivus TaxID=1517983 RepID=A0ABV0QLV4_9TELE
MNSPPNTVSSSCRWAGFASSPVCISPSVLHQGSRFACSVALWASRARAAIDADGLRKDSACFTVTTERGGASMGGDIEMYSSTCCCNSARRVSIKPS